MKSGFLYPAVNGFVIFFRFLSLVELFKFIASRFAGRNASIKKRNAYARVSVDLFIILKFALVAFLLARQLSGPVALVFVWYLLVMNLYTYFYYHLWSERVIEDRSFGVHRIKRRFMTLTLAIHFSVLGFAYLYRVPYVSEFTWGRAGSSGVRSLLYSFSNSFGAGYSRVEPSTEMGQVISAIQFLSMFVFLAIILSTSIPQAVVGKEED